MDLDVTTTAGRVTGSDRGDGVRTYLGIPFAAPPTGERRWRPPAPPGLWTGVRNATAFGCDPMQAPRPDLRGLRPDEDCLTLNVWTPATGSGEKLPVMVWLYGGGFTSGAASSLVTDGAALARRGVVVVAPNYRLGVFGFLAHPALSAEAPDGVSGNYGLLDQIAALEWVRDNIAAFGGDPGRVTLFGVSAGGACISVLMTSPLADGLFHQAIVQSPGALRRLAPLAQAEEAGRLLGDDLAALRALPADPLLARTSEFSAGQRGLSTPRVLRPIHDGRVVPRDERDAYAGGHFRAMPMIVGGAEEEGDFFLPALSLRTVAAYRDYVRASFGAMADDVLAAYPAEDDADVPRAWSRVFGDSQFNMGARGVARCNAAREPRTFRYAFTYRAIPGRPATHTDELPFVFGTVAPVAPAHRALAEAMMDAWARFAATGDPNGGDLPAWPAYDGESDRHFEFGDRLGAGTGWRADELDVLDRAFAAL